MKDKNPSSQRDFYIVRHEYNKKQKKNLVFCGVLWYNGRMELSHKVDKLLATFVAVVFALLIGVGASVLSRNTYAGSEDNTIYETDGAKFVTFYDDGEKLTVKTDAKTVEEALSRADILLSSGDRVEPELDAEINADNFFINIHRARPVIVKDGLTETYLMTSSYDAKSIMSEAGVTVYDGDEIELAMNANFLETGVANVYQLIRNGGRTLTEEEEIPFDEETVKDYSLAVGTSEVRQLGEVGRKRVYYDVQYVDNVEVSREIITEEIVQAPVVRVVAVGARPSLRPNAEVCAGWAREAGVSEADMAVAIDLIYRESGCRVDAMNASSGAYGIPQALPGEKMAPYGDDWRTNPVTQIRWMIDYVDDRYGGWTQAIEWWYEHGWY